MVRLLSVDNVDLNPDVAVVTINESQSKNLLIVCVCVCVCVWLRESVFLILEHMHYVD